MLIAAIIIIILLVFIAICFYTSEKYWMKLVIMPNGKLIERWEEYSENVYEEGDVIYH